MPQSYGYPRMRGLKTFSVPPPPVGGVLTLQTLAVSSTFTPAMTERITFQVVLAVASTFAVSLVTVTKHFVTLAIATAWTVALATRSLFKVALAVSSTFAVNIQKKIAITLAVTSTFTANMQKKMFVSLAVASTFTVALATRLTALVTLAVSSTFTAVLNAVFQPFTGAGYGHSRFFGRRHDNDPN